MTSWFISPNGLAIYRGLMTVYFWIVSIGRILQYVLYNNSLGIYGYSNDVECYLCYFTNLSYVGQTLYFTAAFIHNVIYCRTPEPHDPISFKQQPNFFNWLFWVLYHTIVHYHFIVVFVYWALLSGSLIDSNPPAYIWWLAISVHGGDFLAMMIELFLNRQIMKKSFVILTCLGLLLFMLESFVVFESSGLWVYSFLDWKNGSPSTVAIRYVLFLVSFVVVYFIVYGLHLLRDWIGKKLHKKRTDEKYGSNI
ncbi:17737_t:CDS:2 [Acaulospora morrowiae]|uniref:17737_t:CDS:1 n=1 Tax=Acaulospora morrowiae TaxID=94023 RepID=A0A9N8WG83_9GLOM|nr:17737_t:CDS:2 [Acaulospora morrowiae]